MEASFTQGSENEVSRLQTGTATATQRCPQIRNKYLV